MQQDSAVALHKHGYSLEQKTSSVIARGWGDLSFHIGKELASWRVFRGPKVSTAIGAKRYWLPMMAYFYSLREAASSAPAPASRADPVTYDSARGHATVTSQHKDIIIIIIIKCNDEMRLQTRLSAIWSCISAGRTAMGDVLVTWSCT